MDLLDLLFRTGNVLQVIFKLGYIPKENEFYEFTYQQYQQYFDQYGYTDEKIYILLPEDREKYKAFAAGDVFCMTEMEKEELKRGEAFIEKYCRDSQKEFKNMDEKLCYVASKLPPVFSQDTPYAREDPDTLA